MKVLIAPVGLYLNRVLKSIATLKPDRIYLCITKPKSVKEGKEVDLYKKWSILTSKLARKIKRQITPIYSEREVKVLEIDTDDYLASFKEILKLVLELQEKYDELEVFLDITSATSHLKTAFISLSIFLEEVKCVYTHAAEPLLPSEYPQRVIKDKGRETVIIPTPKVDFSDLRKGELKDILVTIKTKFGGKASSLTDLLGKLGMEVNRANMIKMSKLTDKLQHYGCVLTKKSGRWKEIELTMIGNCIAEVLAES